MVKEIKKAMQEEEENNQRKDDNPAPGGGVKIVRKLGPNKKGQPANQPHTKKIGGEAMGGVS